MMKPVGIVTVHSWYSSSAPEVISNRILAFAVPVVPVGFALMARVPQLLNDGVPGATNLKLGMAMFTASFDTKPTLTEKLKDTEVGASVTAFSMYNEL